MRASVRRLEETYSDRVDFHILDVDLVSTRDLVLRYGVTSIPHIVLLDARGEVFREYLGYMTAEELSAAIEELLAAGG